LGLDGPADDPRFGGEDTSSPESLHEVDLGFRKENVKIGKGAHLDAPAAVVKWGASAGDCSSFGLKEINPRRDSPQFLS